VADAGGICGKLAMRIIYLDSSFYSRLSDPRVPASKRILEELAPLVDSKVIAAPVSAFHISECAALDGQIIELARLRGQVMKQLSGGRSFRFFTEFVSQEIANAVRSHLPSREVALSNEGAWYPDIAPNIRRFRERIRADMAESIKSEGGGRLNRRARRRLLTELMPRGYLRNDFQEMLMSQRSILMKRVLEEFPVENVDRLTSKIMKFIIGDQVEAEIVEELRCSLNDPEFVLGWMLNRYDKQQKIPSWLRNPSEKMAEKIVYIRRNLIDELSKLGMSEVEAELLDDFIGKRDFQGSIKRGLVQSAIASRSGDRETQGMSVEQVSALTLPAFDTLSEALVEYIRRMLLGRKSQRKARSSDFVDLLHAMYLPYVDIFCCDGFMAQVLDKTSKRQDVCLVTDPYKLVDVVLARRA
jgi:hypothetical protein